MTTAVVRVASDDPRYPAALRMLGGGAPEAVAARGNLEPLRRPKLALLCSQKCSGTLILRAYDLTQALREAGICVVSGFHSPIEEDCLKVLLRGRQPVIVCPARSIERMRVPHPWRDAFDAGRLLMLSPFHDRPRRASVESAAIRNRFVAALGDALLVIHAEPDGKTLGIVTEALQRGKAVYTLDADANVHLIRGGARIIAPNTAGDVLKNVWRGDQIVNP